MRMRAEIARPWLMLTLFAALTVLVYWPALQGGFFFDDHNLVENPDLHVTTLHLGDWIRAALSQAGTNQFRALSMLTFAANYYFTGLDPFWLKATNVGIHLLNGLMLFLMLRELLRLWRVTASDGTREITESRCALIATSIAGAWLLLPINLTGVAYVSQRLESLANLFVFLGLYWYLRVRIRHYIAGGGAPCSLSASLFVRCSASARKESAVLLPLFAICIEFSFTNFRNRDGASAVRYS